MNEVLAAALSYAARGWYVFPIWSAMDGTCTCPAAKTCSSPGKHPRGCKNGLKDASIEAPVIERWYQEFPDAGVAIVCGAKSGIVVVDCDPRHGGEESIDALEAKFGKFPHTVTVLTGGGGSHRFYKHPGVYLKSGANRYGPQFPGVDQKAEGSYVVGAPSRHVSGKQYIFEASSEPDTTPLADLPQWIVDMTRGDAPASVGEIMPGDGDGFVHVGTQESTMVSFAGVLRARGLTAAEMLPMMRSYNDARFRPVVAEKDLRRMANSIAKKPAGPVNHETFRGTDMWNAARLVEENRDDIKYCATLKQWFFWNGVTWATDGSEAFLDRASQTMVNGLWDAVRDMPETDKEGKPMRAKFFAHVNRSSNAAKLRDMIQVARSDERIQVAVEEFDSDRMILNCRNGILDLATGQLRPHDRDSMVTMCARPEYDPDAKAPVWEAFLERVMGGDLEMISFLQRAIGYSITGSVSEECFLVMYGSGANGKSKFIGALTYCLGDYAKAFPVEVILKKKFDQNDYQMAELRGVRFAPTSESNEDRELDEAKVKKATGGDQIQARKIYGHPFTFDPHFTIWVATNKRPSIRATDEAMWRRVRLLPFEVTIPEGERNLQLEEQLQEEAAGILAWAVRGALEWGKVGLAAPEKVRAATKTYRDEEDDAGLFLEAQCAQGAALQCAMSALYAAYEEFSEEPMTQRAFGARMREKGFVAGKAMIGGKQVRSWSGVALYSESPGREAAYDDNRSSTPDLNF